MIDTSNAKWDLSPEEKYAIKWFNDNGFDGKLVKQYLSKTKFDISKDGVSDKFELPQWVEGLNTKEYMEQFRRSFDMLCEIQAMKARLDSK